MTVYRGDRTMDGIMVTADDVPLDPRTETRCYCKSGFEWSYEGDAPSQLAYAILAHHFGSVQQAEQRQDAFMRSVVANFHNEWEMTSEDVDRALAAAA